MSRSPDPFSIESAYINWVKTSWDILYVSDTAPLRIRILSLRKYISELITFFISENNFNHIEMIYLCN